MTEVECLECGRQMNINPPKKNNGVDWVKVVCSNCGTIKEFSMVRLKQATKNKKA